VIVRGGRSYYIKHGGPGDADAKVGRTLEQCKFSVQVDVGENIKAGLYWVGTDGRQKWRRRDIQI